MRRRALLAVVLVAFVALVLVRSGPAGAASWSVTRSAAGFDRHGLVRPDDVARIREGGTLGGAKKDWGITGWVEYDLDLPRAGWYDLTVAGNGGGVQYQFDVAADGPAFHGVTWPVANLPEKVGNVWLETGPHRLRIQRYFWTGFPKLGGFTLAAGDPLPAHAVRMTLPDDARIYRRGECPKLEFLAGGLPVPIRLDVVIKTAAGQVRRSDSVTVPAGSRPERRTVALHCSEEGHFDVIASVGVAPLSYRDVRPVSYEVVDTAPAQHAGPGEALRRTLVEEIDCANTFPDYSAGGSRVVTTAAGRYRESVGHGFTRYQRVPAAVRAAMPDPSWFAYELKRVVPQQPYMVEVDYPDDAPRTFAIALRESAHIGYPVAGGVDSGGEFALTNRMQTQSLIYWPRSAGTRVTLLDVHDERHAAAAKIRVYRIDGEFPPLAAARPGGRQFVNWYEEGMSFLAMYGAPGDHPQGLRTATERWAAAVRHAGGTVLAPTSLVYSFALYPSRFNLAFSTPDSDVLRRMVLVAEKYGLSILPEVHPRADELDYAFAAVPDPKPNLLVSKDGRTGYYEGDGKSRRYPPYYNPLHPANQAWYLDMVGELAERYRDSPALIGVSLRLMQWANATLNNFHSLDWGYDDLTVGLFQKETGLVVPEGGPSPGGRVTAEIARRRHAWLTGPGRDRWIRWRCEKIAELYTRLRDRVQSARPDLKIYSPVFAWEGMEGNDGALREAGIDPALLGAIRGVVLINATGSYGRREADKLTVQRNRDFQLEPRHLAAFPPGLGSRAFLSSASYLEATEIVVPPAKLGFPAATKAAWMSAVANPAGRHALERFAVQLAETDAAWMGDGGNGYSLGQPVLWEWLREYRALPSEPFTRRDDAIDPVAVWTLARADGLYFYAVNRERYPVRVSIRIEGAKAAIRLASNESVALPSGRLEFEMAPYELRSYTARPGSKLSAISLQSPDREAQRIERQVAWLADLERRADGLFGPRLDSAQRAQLRQALATVRQAMAAGHFWRARTALEQHFLLSIYEKAGGLPPSLRSDARELE